jgi:hypothetical protein
MNWKTNQTTKSRTNSRFLSTSWELEQISGFFFRILDIVNNTIEKIDIGRYTLRENINVIKQF